MMPRRLAAVLLLLLAATLPAAAADLHFPALTGRVVDQAGIIPADVRARLEAVLERHEKATSNQIVVVTLKSLEGDEIEDYGNRLGRAWGIGQKDRNNGVLLIVAPNERRARIEVGYGLEGALPDATGFEIVQNRILPRFRENDYPGGIEAGVAAIASALAGSYTPLPVRGGPQQQPPSWFLLAPLAFFLFMAFLLLRYQRNSMRRGPWGNRGSYYGGPMIVTGGGFGGSSFGSGGGISFSGGGGSFGGGGASGSW